jgi:hypothetical protein
MDTTKINFCSEDGGAQKLRSSSRSVDIPNQESSIIAVTMTEETITLLDHRTI